MPRNYVGLQIELKEMLGLGGDIVVLTALKIVLVGVVISAAMLWLGYGWILSLVVSMILIPTAEAVIIPILDYAAQRPVELIVLGHRQDSVASIHVGSTTKAVVSLSPIPVLVLPLREE